jgi:hypothetical protein
MQLKHKIYRYRKSHGGGLLDCARCKCGAHLIGPDSVALHEEVADLERELADAS